MSYIELLLAHGAFYKWEKRAKAYDKYLSNKQIEKWTAERIDLDEVSKLFNFIWKWDRNFKRNDEKFRMVFKKIYAVFSSINKYDFKEIYFNYNEIKDKISQIFNRVALYYDDYIYQSTDASKILHAINPNLYIMWDSNIREGILGHNDCRYAYDYSEHFIPKMLRKLEIMKSDFITHNNSNEVIFYSFLLDVSDGKSITKLLDQLNFMTYTMPTYFSAYKQELIPLLVNYDKMNLSKQRDFWIDILPKNQYRRQKAYSYYISLLNRARKENLITASERRDLDSKWYNDMEEKEYLINRLKLILNENE